MSTGKVGRPAKRLPGGLHMSLFRRALDKVPQRALLEPEQEIHKWLRSPQPIERADRRPAWSPALYEGGATRCKASVYALSALVLDYDDGTPWETGLAVWREWLGFAHTSWSHTPAHNRYRVVLPFAQPAHPDIWPSLWRWAEARSGRTIDRSCKDSSRIYFVPCVRPGHAAACEYQWDAWRGSSDTLLDPATIDLPPDPPPRIMLATAAEVQALGVYTLSSRGQTMLDARDPAQALQWALEHGGRAGSAPAALAEDFGCPACSRCDTWIGRDSVLAMCRHRQTCGWRGRPWQR